MQLADLDMNKLYTYADYLKWQFEERVELLKGKLFKISPAPNRIHQEVSSHLHIALGNYLAGKNCRLYAAPFDVRLPKKSKDDTDIITVLQPDLCVVCDLAKLDLRGCIGAPDIVVEILSPSNNVVELKNKYDIYEEAGVKEYWVISPQNKTVLVYTLIAGKYEPSCLMVAGDAFTSTVLKGFILHPDQLFEGIDQQ
jgi:Uma2 family endonuclease